jgi:hypothetical protein
MTIASATYRSLDNRMAVRRSYKTSVNGQTLMAIMDLENDAKRNDAI